METQRALYLSLARIGERHRAISEIPSNHFDTGSLTPYELRVFSQNGEDGALAEIVARAGAGERFFVEFGVETGREGNTVYLADVAGWRGLFIEGDAHSFGLLQRKYRANDRVRTTHAIVTPENVQTLFAAAGVPREPTVLSIDVDGSDYWIWDAIDDYRPRVVIIEYNSALDPDRRLVQPANRQSAWDSTEYFGASLGALRALGKSKGYRLVHTELCAVNAFFVRDDLAADRFPAFEDIQVRAIPNYFQTGRGHPPDPEQRAYLDLDTGRLVKVQSPQDAPTLPVEDELSLWRERTLSAEEHLARSEQATRDATDSYTSAQRSYENALAALETAQRECERNERELNRASTLLAERDAALSLAADELAALRVQAAQLETTLATSSASLAILTGSKSWRLTAPLRALGRIGRRT